MLPHDAAQDVCVPSITFVHELPHLRSEAFTSGGVFKQSLIYTTTHGWTDGGRKGTDADAANGWITCGGYMNEWIDRSDIRMHRRSTECRVD